LTNKRLISLNWSPCQSSFATNRSGFSFIPMKAMHIHVRGTDGEAKFWLTPTVYLADSDGFNARTLRELRDAVIANKDLVERTWNDHFA